MKSITRQAECVATGENRSCLCSAHLFSDATNRQGDRIVGFHVLHHSVRKKRHRSRPACPVRRLHKLLTVHVSVAASSSISPFSSTRQLVHRRFCHKVVRTPVHSCRASRHQNPAFPSALSFSSPLQACPSRRP